MHPRARDLIALLGLSPHPEGGHYREIHRSPGRVRAARGERSALTTIYFLLAEGERSRWHRVASDEVWHLYEGDGLELLQLTRDARQASRHLLVPLREGAHPHGAPVHVVPPDTWQAARPLGAYALVGCDVAPGFDFADFDMLADEESLAERVRADFPDLASLI